MNNYSEDWCQRIDIQQHLRQRNESELDAIHQAATQKFVHIASDASTGIVKFAKKTTSSLMSFNDYLNKRLTTGHLYLYNHGSEVVLLNLPIDLIDHLNSSKYGAPAYTAPQEARESAGWFENKLALKIVLLFNNFYPRIWNNQLGISPIPDSFIDINKIPFDIDTKLFILEHEITIDNAVYVIEYMISDNLVENLSDFKETSAREENIARLEKVEINLNAVLLNSEMTLEEVRKLKVGSLIPLHDVDQVDIETSDGTLIAKGTMGIVNSKRAVKIR